MFSCIKKQKALKTSSLSINKLPGLFNLNFCNFSHGFKYDLFVIGGGSGGLAAAKEAAKYSKKIAVADYVTPTPKNTKWGLGGTCVNVGCIPKKLYHYAALKMEDLDVYGELGLSVEYKTKEINKKYINPFTKEFIDRSFIKPVVDWEILRNKIQQYVKKLNFGHRSNLRQNGIAFYNKLAKLVDKNTIILSDDKGNTEQVTSDKILISVGGRPSYGGIKGAIENCITSDDIFSLVKPPGKTLIVGGSYIALETAGFLNGLGYETKVMVRSILLRGFDQTMANRIGSNMADHGVEFIMEAIPIEFIKELNGIKVVYQDKDGKQQQELYDTVILAVGREAVINSLNLTNLGITIQKNKIKVDDYDKTNVDGIFAIGDCSFGRPELTPPAIRAGRLLAKRLYVKDFDEKMNYNNIATTVFTPLEYSCVGLSEEDAIKLYGDDNVDVFHSEFKALEWNVNLNNTDDCYVKAIYNKKDKNRVVGIHILSPNSGEIMQGFSAAFNLGITKEHLDNTCSIHPTVAEELTLLKFNKKEDGLGKKDGC